MGGLSLAVPEGERLSASPSLVTAGGAEGREVLDVLGVGFGPANLALGVCLEEAEEDGGIDFKRLFLEHKARAAWHPGMLLEDSLIQISVLKDLATVRNPRSRFTFLNYLKTRGRLYEFLNLRDLFPTRIEFNDYLGWVAGELAHRVRYGRQVVAVEPVAFAGGDHGANGSKGANGSNGSNGAGGAPGGASGPGNIELLRVVSRDVASGALEQHLTRNLVLATGGVPCLPAGITLAPGGRAFHAHEFMLRIKRDFPDRDGRHRFVVVGSGQSAAELFLYLLTHYPHADVTSAIRRYAYKPVDDSDFTNEIFFPQMVDTLYGLPPAKRKMVLDQCRDVNYAVVDLALIRRIYRCLYQERVEGKSRARIRPFVEIQRVEELPGEVRGEFVDLLHDEPVTLAADALVLATGYTWRRRHPLLDSLAAHLEVDADGAYRIERDYRLATRPGFAPRIYLQGFAEDTHGASETVLSLLPVRAGDIVESMRTAPRARSAVALRV